MKIDDAEQKLFSELLWDALAVTRSDQWTDYPAVVATFCRVATYDVLEGRFKDVAGRDGMHDEARAIADEMKRRRDKARRALLRQQV